MTDGGAMALSPTDPNVIFTTGTLADSTGTQKMAIDYTTDGGTTWNHVIIDDAYWGWGIVFDPFNSNRVYAAGGTENSSPRFLVSTDLGQTWTESQTGLPGTAGTICPDPLTPGTIYCATAYGLYKSTDCGQTWQVTGLAETINALFIDPDNGDIYAGTSTGVHCSSDGGANWDLLNDGLTTPFVCALARSSGPEPRFYAGTNGGGMFRTMPITAVAGSDARGIGRGMTVTSPCHEFATVRWDALRSGSAGRGCALSLDLFDASGRIVRQSAISGLQSETRLDLRGLSAGTYLLRLAGSGRAAVRKVVVTR